MLLEKLSEYADRIDLPPMMYREQPVRYILQLDHTGRYLGMIDRATEQEKRGPQMVAPDRKRGFAIKPKLLTDNAEYVLGIGRVDSEPARVQTVHTAFTALTQHCADETGEPAVAAVATFLTRPHSSAATLGLPADFDPGATITFEVDGARPIDLPSVQRFWAHEASAADEDEPPMECLVCGQLRPPVVPLPLAVKGIPGGNPSGTVLVSANVNAFESYGLENVRTSPICEPCGLRIGYALNALLADERTSLWEEPNKYIFWAREPAPAPAPAPVSETPLPFPVATLLSRADEADVRQLLAAEPSRAAHPQPAAEAGAGAARWLDETPFYAATLSANNARVVVRDWIETTLGEAQRHLQRYFALQRLVDATGQDRWFPFWMLTHATVNAKSQQEAPVPQVGQALLRLALHGDPLPEWLLYLALRRMRVGQQVTAPHVSLIKMVLLTQAAHQAQPPQAPQPPQPQAPHVQPLAQAQVTAEERIRDMAELDMHHRDRAYLCGRLLAELDAVHWAALGQVGRGIIGRSFGMAASAPALVLARLLRGTQPHLMTLRTERPDVYRQVDEQLREILSHLPQFPRSLTLRQQGMFVLGYYHQRAANIRAARAQRAERDTASQRGRAGRTQRAMTAGRPADSVRQVRSP